MFPIPWNKAFRKKDGTLVNMEDATGGGSGSIPPHSAADAGKVLGVASDGSLAWIEAGGGITSYKANTNITPNNIVVSAEEVV